MQKMSKEIGEKIMQKTKVKTKEELAKRLADLSDPPITANDISDSIFDEYNQTIEEYRNEPFRSDCHYARLNKWIVEYIHEEID